MAGRVEHNSNRFAGLAKGVSIDEVDSNGHTPLLRAIDNSHIDLALLLIKFGADPNAKPGRRTPLQATCKNGLVSIARALLAEGALVDAPDNHGNTPLHNAIYWGQSNLALLLMRFGADPNTKNWQEQTPLQRAKIKGMTNVVEALLANASIAPLSYSQ